MPGSRRSAKVVCVVGPPAYRRRTHRRVSTGARAVNFSDYRSPPGSEILFNRLAGPAMSKVESPKSSAHTNTFEQDAKADVGPWALASRPAVQPTAEEWSVLSSFERLAF